MEVVTNMSWEVGPTLSSAPWKSGEGIESPTFKTHDGVSWGLDFYPAGDGDNAENLVFWLNRDNADKHMEVSFEIQFCFNSTPVRQYTLHHVFEKGEDVHKWIIDDLKNLAQLKIFIPTSALCLIGYLRVQEIDQSANPTQSVKKYQRITANV